ncbi:hypothetical protein BDR06DRAFT_793496 [Suillus hirtellus]|nr:hypothetical protein BDR06DRAFT_793496 [Suillus hirtellus]
MREKIYPRQASNAFTVHTTSHVVERDIQFLCCLLCCSWFILFLYRSYESGTTFSRDTFDLTFKGVVKSL